MPWDLSIDVSLSISSGWCPIQLMDQAGLWLQLTEGCSYGFSKEGYGCMFEEFQSILKLVVAH